MQTDAFHTLRELASLGDSRLDSKFLLFLSKLPKLSCNQLITRWLNKSPPVCEQGSVGILCCYTDILEDACECMFCLQVYQWKRIYQETKGEISKSDNENLVTKILFLS